MNKYTVINSQDTPTTVNAQSFRIVDDFGAVAQFYDENKSTIAHFTNVQSIVLIGGDVTIRSESVCDKNNAPKENYRKPRPISLKYYTAVEIEETIRREIGEFMFPYFSVDMAMDMLPKYKENKSGKSALASMFTIMKKKGVIRRVENSPKSKYWEFIN